MRPPPSPRSRPVARAATRCSPGAHVADRIALTGLTVRGFHGVFDFERRDGQDFVVDVVLESKTAPAAATAHLTKTVSYGELAGALAEVVAGEPVQLLETLAQRLADVCRVDHRVE